MCLLSEPRWDAVVVGSGPNGLTAGITLARAGRSVLLLEGSDAVGGGARSAELTLPGFTHDVCSAVHPLAVASPFLRGLPLPAHGLDWVHPPAPLAHPFDDGTAAVLERSIRLTTEGLGPDGPAYHRLMQPLVASWEGLAPQLLGPAALPANPLALARFGLPALCSAVSLARSRFRGGRARALFAGLSAHSMLPLERPVSAAFGLVLGITGHAVGWPLARGGSGRIAEALSSYLRSLGGEIATDSPVASLSGLPQHGVALMDVTPRQLLAMAGGLLPAGYRDALARYRYGPGVFKMDWALSGPIPWGAADCVRAGTVHLGGSLEEVAAAEGAVWRGEHPERPFVVLAQPSLFDPSRAPAGRHTVWAYCHVPNGSSVDMTGRIEEQIERFAPGFKDLVLGRHVASPAWLERHNPNYVGGDINGGVQDIRQLFTRPVPRVVPYSTPVPGLYICSSSTPPGGGVHGMCGYHAARAALRHGKGAVKFPRPFR